MLEARNLTKSFGALAVTAGVSLSIGKGERRVILGPNGAGKTTLFNLLAGTLKPDGGAILLDGRDITRLRVDARARAGLARSYQKNNLFAGLSVRENLALAAAIAQGKSAGLGRDTLRDPEIMSTVDEVTASVGLGDWLDRPVDAVPYGARRQLEVGLALACRPLVLLMDEPTSGFGPGAIDRFHGVLRSLPADLTLVVIEHDMDLAFDIADRITVLNYGEVVFDGTPDAARTSALVREIYLGTWGEPAGGEEAGGADA